MYTFSQMIDNLIAELLRPDQRVAMANALNQTIRELHFTAEHLPIGYASNMIEEVLTATVDSGFTYPLTDPRNFQMVEAVYYPMYDRYATPRRPSSIRAFTDNVDGAEFGYYRSGDSLSYLNYGGKNAQILLAWFMFVPRLQYYQVADRPASWDEENQQFTYTGTWGATPESRLEAESLCTNWMIQRWWDLLASGVRAKVWARMGDVDRAKLAYSLYENSRPNLAQTETYIGSPRYRR